VEGGDPHVVEDVKMVVLSGNPKFASQSAAAYLRTYNHSISSLVPFFRNYK
jgi:hypothetical protein